MNIEEINGKIFRVRLSKFINIVLTLVLLFVGVVMLFST